MNILKGFTFSHTHGENKNHNPIGHDVKLLKSLYQQRRPQKGRPKQEPSRNVKNFFFFTLIWAR